MIRKIASFLLCLVGFLLVLYCTGMISGVDTPPLFHAVMNNYSTDTLATNAVASIYLNYRIFDTVFEALMLLVSVMGVIHFSRHLEKKSLPENPKQSLGKASIDSMSFLLPLIIMMGIYLILNGQKTPGGGFQGGAMLCAALICRYLVWPEKEINLDKYQRIEKTLFLLLAITAVIFGVSAIYLQHIWLNPVYLIVMNTLIGFKVFCGLSIIFIRFVHYEDR